MADCLFCKIASGEIPCTKIDETEEFLAFLDINPIHLGHTLIIPKKHVKDFHEFPEKLGEQWMAFTKKIMKQVKQGTDADAINIGMNNGSAAGQVIFHQHTHIIPRYTDDGLKNWQSKKASPEELEEIADKIKG